KVLDPIREQYGKPIRVNSGYRSSALNTALKGSATSQHLGSNAAAADITGGSVAENRKIFDIAKQLMQEGKIEFDQLIDESNLKWVHIGIKINRNQILKM
ncbi:MAG: D-Ala-D-Ala carboxypeptidase family metallohydrolase, partial [Lentimicrobiaceae bacterium]|nr:D-Ala-D-Ala carboxypeptidase family metallohydrolase [Lentimicrobiaceae bacterium]